MAGFEQLPLERVSQLEVGLAGFACAAQCVFVAFQDATVPSWVEQMRW